MNLKRHWALLIWILLLAVSLGACSLLDVDSTTAPTGTGTAVPPNTTETAETPTADETPEVGEATQEPVTSGPLTLRIWLPPQFVPDPATEAGALLDDRLDEFALLNPGIRITVRMKSDSGPGGIVSSLAATSSAVPDALPDLVLIPRLEMERAVRSRLLLSYSDPFEEDWYDFARSLGSINQDVYGLPFATDALVMLYRPEVILDPPKDWTTTLNSPTPLLFAGGSANSLFTFALYSAAGGQLVDDNQRLFLDEAALTALLAFYSDAQTAGVFAAETSQITDENIVYQRFQESASDLAVTWVSNRFQNPEDTAAATGLPTVSSRPYTLVDGWLWSVTNPDPARQALATQLAQFLTAPDFLAAWSTAAGYLPPRSEALALWVDSPEASLASRIVLSANPLPSLDIIEKTGPALQQAVVSVLSGELEPAAAASSAAQRINSQ